MALIMNSLFHTVLLAELFERIVMALMGRVLFFLFVVQVVLVSSTTTIISTPNQASPATLATGNDIILNCSSTLTNPSYMWDTTLTNGDGSSVDDEVRAVTGKYLHGSNIGTHTCTATAGGTEESADYQISVQGTRVWYAFPTPGGVLPNNIAIAVHTTVNEIRCYSPDITATNDDTMILTPPGSAPLVFTNDVAGKKIKTGGTSIDDIDGGLYTCRYSNGGVTVESNFAIYSREREPENNGTPLAISSVDYTITGTTMIVTCISTGWPATTVQWTKASNTLTNAGIYSFAQTVINRPESTYENTLTVTETSLENLLSDYGCEIETLRHNGEIIDTTSGSVCVQSAGTLIMSVSTLEDPEVGQTYDLNCTVNIEGNIPTLTWKKGNTVLTNDSSNAIIIGNVVNNGLTVSRSLILGPLSQSHGGQYTCSAMEGSNTGIVAINVDVEIPLPIIKLNNSMIVSIATPIILNCSVTVPSSLSGMITNITWFFGSTIVTDGVSTMLNQGESTLDLGTIKTAQAGGYTCEARVVSLYIDMDTDVSSSVTCNISIQLPLISSPIFAPSPLSFPYYTGTKRGFNCQFFLTTLVLTDPDIIVDQIYRRGDELIVFDDRITRLNYVVIPGSNAYSGTISFDYLRLMDNGTYYCDVVITSSVQNEFVLTTLATALVLINVEVPTPSVYLTSSAYRFPDHDDYNDQTLTCTSILPLMQPIDELEFDKQYKWELGGVDVTSMATGPTKPDEIESVGMLNVALSTIGDNVIECEVFIDITGDPLVTNSTTLTVDVLGPASPNAPINLDSSDIQYNRATILWTVSILAYTPEQYTVIYGTSESSLTNTSMVVNGGNNFDSLNDEYQVTITDLVFSTVYYYSVRAINTEGSTDSVIQMFKTKERPPTAPPEGFNITVLNSTAVILSWGPPPVGQRNGMITNYTLTCNEMVDGAYSTVVTITFLSPVSENDTILTELDEFRPGTPITCNVSASNFAGIGPPAIETVTTIEERPGGSPRQFLITYMTSRTFNLTWLSPDPFLQYGVITSYNVTCKEQGQDTIASSYPRVYTIDPYPDSITVDNLRPYTDYECSVIAINSAGSSDPVSDSSTTDEDDPDGTPNDFTLTTTSSSSFTVTWRPIDKLLQNGEIVNYTIDCNDTMVPEMEVSPISSIENSMGEYTYSIIGFSPGTQYQCAIYANTSVGAGPSAYDTGRTLEERPSTSPVNITITSTSNISVIISWLPPDIPNGIITQYTLYVILVDCSDSITESSVPVIDGMDYEITGMSPYQQIRVQVSGSTAIGEGPRSAMMLGRSGEKVPDKLRGIMYIPLNHTTLSVTVPLQQDISIARGVITLYYSSIVLYDDSTVRDSDSYMTGFIDGSYCIDDDDLSDATGDDLHNFTFTQLVPQTPYNVTVNASNSAGYGDADVIIMFSQEGAPPKPTNITVNRINDTAMIVRWSLISITEANGHILGYTITYTRDNSRTRQTMSDTAGPNDNELTVGNLISGVSYTVTVSANTGAGYGDSSDTLMLSSSQQSKSGISPTVIIIPVVLIILMIAIVVVIIAIVLIRKRQRNTSLEKQNTSEFELGSYKQSIDDIEKADMNGTNCMPPTDDDNTDPTALTLDDRLKPIPKSVFSQHVKEMHKDRDRGFELEYQSLTNPTIIPHEAAEHPANRAKNRFANIKPFDFSRVILKMVEGVEGSDYINASYMDGYNKRDSYIAAQGPITNTVVDFWRMVWEHKLDTIVMLTKCREGGKRKCEEYWPDQIHEPKDMGCSITVTLTAITPYADFEKKIFRVLKEDEPDSKSIDVIHWHFLGWPDHGVPQYATSLISFIRHVRKHRGKHGPPILTHCSAGVGRTGTFILLDSMLERLLVEDTLNVYEFLRQMRSKRVFMVQTVQQYVFIHDALDELITCGDTDIAVQTLKNKIEHMHKIIPGKGCSAFDYQFQLLGQVCRKPTEPDCSDALIDANQQKNRYPDRLPYNICRARLRPTGAPGSDYINASFVDGYKLKNAYIASQAPMSKTVHDFWRLVWEFKSKAIVQLCELEENGIEVCYQYWPTRIGEPMQFNKLIVTLQSENKKLGYYIRKFEIKEDRAQPASFIITQYQYCEWPEHSCPETYENMLVLMEDLNKVQRSTGNKPITVMCNDGMGRSGTFICIHAQQDRMKTEAVIDIFHYIKSIRIQRAGLVADLEQFILCHQTLTKFYGRFDSYSNFNC